MEERKGDWLVSEELARVEVAGLRERIDEIGRLLESEYGRPAPRRKLRPLDELILTILSQHTTDANSGRAFERLKSAFPSWEEARDAEPDEIAEAIRCGGLARIKAVRIKQLLQHLDAELGRLDLDFLCDMEMEEARRYLLGLEGVGPKTAACVLLFSCNLPAFPVDTHVHRVSRRLGLIPPTASAEDAHQILQKAVPVGEVYSFHVNLITHGRRVCKAQRPLCDQCVLAPHCDYFTGRLGTEPPEANSTASD
ncbi:MAG TPA: endonuclease III [Chloroflexota bacterium]|nr:endonuclease III [Chloroflexota bacterium]